ncbi:MAG TPA: hypothetical protein VLA48_02950 [Nitrososphaeraceae archaeon]|nr:hypothetical protein [Nitrososphaeraceae archaeon]
MSGFKSVSKSEFYEYFQDKEFTRQAGDYFHSEYFVVNGERVGYLETSSWGAPDAYQFKYGTSNSETISFIGNIINKSRVKNN